MEEYYVFNHRLPQFPLTAEKNKAALQKQIQEYFKVWLWEKQPASTVRRRICEEYFQFAVWMESQGVSLENLTPGHLEQWPFEKGKALGFFEFREGLKKKMPDLPWST